MKFLLLLLPLVLCVVPPLGELKPQFDSFLTKFGKSYNGNEYLHRLTVFRENLVLAEQRMKEDPLAQHGVTKFSDLTSDEFQAQYLMPNLPTATLAKPCLRNGIFKPGYRNFTSFPDTWDWRKKDNTVTKVKDQGSCGSCWAFSTAGNMEGVVAVANGPAQGKDLSPQYIVDCSKGCSWEMYYGSNITVCNQGCGGGWPWSAYFDIINQGGLPGWDDYPYTGTTGTCKGNSNAKTLVKITSYSCIGLDRNDNEDEMAQECYNRGPLSIALYANPLQSYTGGILNPPNCVTAYLNHAVTLVGWGTENNVPYWLVKNSWGASWGESGYFRMYRGKGVCGINEAIASANYP